MTISEVKRMARVSEWKGLIQEQKESGMTIRAWCKQNGLVLSRVMRKKVSRHI